MAVKAQSLREKTDQELQDQLMLEKKRMFDGVVKGASGEAIKPHEKRDGRRLIARIQTILSERACRAELDKRIVALTPAAKEGSSRFAGVLRQVEERLVVNKAELAKEKGQRKTRPAQGRIKLRSLLKKREQVTANDRAVVRLAEARRLRGALEREDMGQAK